MTTRHAHTRVLAHVALVKSLSPNHRKVYDFLYLFQPNSFATSLTFQTAFEWSQQYASSILKELADFGLLEREEVITDSGREFRYRLAK